LLFTDTGMFPLILDFIIWFKIFDFYNLTIFLIYRFNFIIVNQIFVENLASWKGWLGHTLFQLFLRMDQKHWNSFS
jgi:hypothetical protein